MYNCLSINWGAWFEIANRMHCDCSLMYVHGFLIEIYDSDTIRWNYVS